MNKDIEKTVGFLKKCDIAYENGDPEISDDEYDLTKEELRNIAPEHDYFKNVGGISDKSHGWQKEYIHKYPMGSLLKDKSPEKAEDWLTKTYPNTKDLVFLLQAKLDGSSVAIIYNFGKIDKIVSRGNGVRGFDITLIAKHIKDIPAQISEKGYIEIKGECVKDKDSFYKIWEPKGYNDPRSFVPGTLNSKPDEHTSEMMKERDITFIAYETRGKNFATETEKMKFLLDNKFRTLKDSTAKVNCTGRTHKEIIAAFKKYMDRIDRNKFEFQLDGIVIKNDDIAASEKLGVVNLRPKGSRAIKFPCEEKNVIIERIEWETGKSGVVTPVAILTPIFLSGATITRATLHNIKEMARLGIDKVPYEAILIRSGDIIPKLVKGIGSKSNAKDIIFPKVCPTCSEPLFWDKTETNKVCQNINCSAQLGGKIDYYLKTLGIKGIGRSTIDTLTEKNYVKSLSDMYDLKKYTKELSNIFGDRAFPNILEAMEQVKEMSLAKFIESLSIGKIGTMAKEITAIAPTIKDVDNLKESDLLSIPGFAETKTRSFLEGWSSMRPEIDKLLKYIKITEVKLASKKLEGISFCVTGTLSQPRDYFVNLIEKNGGKFTSVSSKLNYLIVGEDAGGKKDKAEKLGVKVISEKDFLALL